MSWKRPPSWKEVIKMQVEPISQVEMVPDFKFRKDSANTLALSSAKEPRAKEILDRFWWYFLKTQKAKGENKAMLLKKKKKKDVYVRSEKRTA